MFTYMVNRPMFDTRIVHEKYMMFWSRYCAWKWVENRVNLTLYFVFFFCLGMAWHCVARIFLVANIEYSIDLRKMAFVRQKRAGWLACWVVWKAGRAFEILIGLIGIESWKPCMSVHIVNWTNWTNEETATTADKTTTNTVVSKPPHDHLLTTSN